MDWLIAAISTSGLIAGVLFLSKNIIITRLSNAVRHEYDAKLENLKATIRQNEAYFTTDLKAKDSQIEALRSGALSGATSRQSHLYQRQMMAVEHLWDAVIALAPAKAISGWMAVINFDFAVKEAATNPKFAELFNSFGQFDGTSLEKISPSKCRPFISPLAWATYRAYEAIVMHAVLRLKTLQFGVGKDFADTDGLRKVVKAALPHRSQYIDNSGTESLHHLLEELESSLLMELKNILDGEKSDKASIERAALILQEVERFSEKGKENRMKV